MASKRGVHEECIPCSSVWLVSCEGWNRSGAGSHARPAHCIGGRGRLKKEVEQRRECESKVIKYSAKKVAVKGSLKDNSSEPYHDTVSSQYCKTSVLLRATFRFWYAWTPAFIVEANLWYEGRQFNYTDIRCRGNPCLSTLPYPCVESLQYHYPLYTTRDDANNIQQVRSATPDKNPLNLNIEPCGCN